MKNWIKKILSVLTFDVKNLEKKKIELEKDLKNIENLKKVQTSNKDFETRKELLGCKSASKNKVEEIKLSNKMKIFHLVDISFFMVFYVFMAIIVFSWALIKIHIPMNLVEIIIGLFTVIYFHIEIKTLTRVAINSSTWLQYIVALILPTIISSIIYMRLMFIPSSLEHCCLHFFYIDKLNYLGLCVVFNIAISVRTLILTLGKIKHSIKN